MNVDVGVWDWNGCMWDIGIQSIDVPLASSVCELLALLQLLCLIQLIDWPLVSSVACSAGAVGRVWPGA